MSASDLLPEAEILKLIRRRDDLRDMGGANSVWMEQAKQVEEESGHKHVVGRLMKLCNGPNSSMLEDLLSKPGGVELIVSHVLRGTSLKLKHKSGEECGEKSTPDKGGHSISPEKVVDIPLSPMSAEKAKSLLENAAFLWLVVQMVKKEGVAREEIVVGSIYVVGTSRLLRTATSATIKADSAAGKNWTLDRVLALFPKEDVMVITRATARALYYLPENGLRNKILVIVEVKGAKDSQESLRWLISEGKLHLLYTSKSLETGDFETKERTIEGPLVVITTTTESELDEDDETRNLSIFLDLSQEQTQQILLKQASVYNGARPLPQETIDRFQDAQRFLRQAAKEYKGTLIPYAQFLAEEFPTEKIRARRDFPRLLNLIEAITFIHQLQRKRAEDGRLIATSVDYGYALKLFYTFLQQSLECLPPRTQEILEAAKKSYPIDEHGIGYEFTRAALATKLKWSERIVRAWVRPLEGTYFEVRQGGQGRQYLYALMQVPDSKFSLPTKEEVEGFRHTSTTSPDFDGAFGRSSPMEGVHKQTATSTTSPGHVCYFDPTEDSPRCPECGTIPSVEAVEAGVLGLIPMESETSTKTSTESPSESSKPTEAQTPTNYREADSEGKGDSWSR